MKPSEIRAGAVYVGRDSIVLPAGVVVMAIREVSRTEPMSEARP